MREKQYEKIVDFVEESGKQLAETKKNDLNDAVLETDDNAPNILQMFEQMLGLKPKSPEEEAAFIEEHLKFEDNTEKDTLTVRILVCNNSHDMGLLVHSAENKVIHDCELDSNMHVSIFCTGIASCWRAPVIPKGVGVMEIQLPENGPTFNIMDAIAEDPETCAKLEEWESKIDPEAEMLPPSATCLDNDGEVVAKMHFVENDTSVTQVIEFHKTRLRELIENLKQRFPLPEDTELNVASVLVTSVEVMQTTKGNPSIDDWKTALASGGVEAN